MTLRLKKLVAYPLWTLLWLAGGVWTHMLAAKQGWREYRWSSRGAWADFGRGPAYIRNWRPPSDR